jgi:CubicO group peptidase (beta-lactamase class C family)
LPDRLSTLNCTNEVTMRRAPATLLLIALSACGGAGAGGNGGAPGAGERGAGGVGGGGSAPPALMARIDSIIEMPIKAGKLAGASIAVVKGSDTIAVKRYGFASLELETPTPPRAVYEIGSVTKQFTGAAIMQLVEHGKLSLDDDITRYLPGLKLGGRKVPIRRLLDHTSGMRGYTEIPEARGLFWRRVPADSIVQLFLSKPWDFEPGEEEIYNNSAFFLAGQVIEKVSGKSYERYVEDELFAKAGMTDSHYCSEREVHKGKVQGYDSDSTGPVLRAPISHAWPYAAGSLCASALDLVAWNQALHRDGKILGPEAYREFITPHQLNDGTTIRYAKGIAAYNRLGRRALHHGGGINGFLSENIYFPDDSLSVVVLFNTAGPTSPDEAALAIAEAVLGKPADPEKPFPGDLSQLAGTYAGKGRGRPVELTVAVADGRLTAKGGMLGDTARVLTHLGDNVFAREETRFLFMQDGGKFTRVRIDAGYGNNVLKRK